MYFVGTETGPSRINAVQRNDSLWAVPVAGGAARRLTDEERYTTGDEIRPMADGIVYANENRGAVELLLVPADGGEPTPLLTGPRQVLGYDRVGDTLVASVTTPTSWGELLVVRNGVERVLTTFGAGYASAVPVLAQEELTATTADGYPVHGWLVRPAGEGPHPVLLMIHGGPFTQYGWRLFDEAQVYAGAGYAVVMGNPRGSSGYGQAHGQAVRGNVGEVSTVDLMALLDAALTDPTLDAARVGVLGGSHGGFMTTWLAAHEGDRFKAAVSERAVNAIDSFTGSSDIGWFFADDLYGPDLDQQRAQSPLTYAGQDRSAGADHPLGAGLALPGGAGAAAVRDAAAARGAVRAAALPGGEARDVPVWAAVASGCSVLGDSRLVWSVRVALRFVSWVGGRPWAGRGGGDHSGRSGLIPTWSPPPRPAWLRIVGRGAGWVGASGVPWWTAGAGLRSGGPALRRPRRCALVFCVAWLWRRGAFRVGGFVSRIVGSRWRRLLPGRGGSRRGRPGGCRCW